MIAVKSTNTDRELAMCINLLEPRNNPVRHSSCHHRSQKGSGGAGSNPVQAYFVLLFHCFELYSFQVHTLNRFAGPASRRSPWVIGVLNSTTAASMAVCVVCRCASIHPVCAYRHDAHFYPPSQLPTPFLICGTSSECFLGPQAFYVLVLPLVLELYGIPS